MIDAEDFLLALVRTLTGATVSPELPPDLADRLPYVLATRIGGAASVPGQLDRAVCDVQTFATTRRAASDLAQTVRVGLDAAWRAQTVLALTGWSGHLAFLTENAAPVPLPVLSGAYRYQGTYSLGVRTLT